MPRASTALGIREAFRSLINLERSEKEYGKDVKSGTLPLPRTVRGTCRSLWDARVFLSFIAAVVRSSLYFRLAAS
jgi:hypothetical protein